MVNGPSVPSGRFPGQLALARPGLLVTDDGERRSGAEREVVITAALQEHTRLLQMVIDNAPIILWAWNTAGVYLLSEGQGLALLGRPPGYSIGKSVFDLYHNHPVALAAARRALRGERFTTEIEIGGRVLECRYSPVVGADGDLVGVIGVSIDVTERVRLQAQLTHESLHDRLTGLPNRTHFMQQLTEILDRARPDSSAAAVLLVDIDRFKVVNDGLGHRLADQVLATIADRLRLSIRPCDQVARLAGDEFAIVLDDMTTHQAILRIAERLIAIIQTPLLISGHEVVVTGSIGISTTTDGLSTAEDLVRAATVALFTAKRAGGNRIARFDPTTHRYGVERFQLEEALRYAVPRDELTVHYQPIVELASHRLVGLEALVRWSRPTAGLVPPTDFIPIAEETGLIRTIGRWTMAEACRQCRDWQRRVTTAARLELSVNLSAHELLHPDLITTITEVLAETQFDPTHLKLEITESVIIPETPAAVARLREIKALGIKLAIDDFGTSYSSLRYLRFLPVDVIKIDRSFVAGLGQSTKDAAIVRAVIAIARTLDLSVTAEGVERQQQLAELQSLGCDLGQGYFFSQPLAAAEIEALLATGSRLCPALAHQ